jgi:hypothetical protein
MPLDAAPRVQSGSRATGKNATSIRTISAPPMSASIIVGEKVRRAIIEHPFVEIEAQSKRDVWSISSRCSLYRSQIFSLLSDISNDKMRIRKKRFFLPYLPAQELP